MLTKFLVVRLAIDLLFLVVRLAIDLFQIFLMLFGFRKTKAPAQPLQIKNGQIGCFAAEPERSLALKKNQSLPRDPTKRKKKCNLLHLSRKLRRLHSKK
jgi:hypothetical protein